VTTSVDPYARQLSLPGFGVAAQRRLAESTVLVAGIGGLGGATATYLAAAGVGRLVLFHPGSLELPDLNRQTLMTPSGLGQLRVDCATEALHRHYPNVAVVAVPEPITADRTPHFLAQSDVVVDARHNFPERLLLNRLCVELEVPMVEAAMNGSEGQVSVVRPGRTACLACRYRDGDPGWEPLGFSVLGAVSGTVGCLAAIEAIKIVTGWGDPLEDRLLTLDLERMNFQTLHTSRDPSCPVCAGSRPASAAATALAVAEPAEPAESAEPAGPAGSAGSAGLSLATSKTRPTRSLEQLMRQSVLTVTVAVAAGLLLAGCGSASAIGGSSTSLRRTGSKSAPLSGTINVFAAASLHEAFTTLGRQFEAAHPGTTVVFNFGPSSGLATQITAGAPADVFASASSKNMAQVVTARQAVSPKKFASNVMEIAVPVQNPANITALADLARPAVKVALCQAAVPCGVSAAEVFSNARLTVTPVTQEVDVKAVLTKVRLGEVDAGVVYVTDIRASGGKVKGIRIPTFLNASTRYPIATLSRAPNKAAATAFTDYVLSPAGARVLSAAGFARP
jgi:molybdate transport system substrate-binding protein